MASPGKVSGEIADILGLKRKAVSLLWDHLRNAELVTKGSRGRYGVQVSYSEAALCLVLASLPLRLEDVPDFARAFMKCRNDDGTSIVDYVGQQLEKGIGKEITVCVPFVSAKSGSIIFEGKPTLPDCETEQRDRRHMTKLASLNVCAIIDRDGVLRLSDFLRSD